MVQREVSDSGAFATDPFELSDERADLGRVQCPNCCKLAYVTRRSQGLLFYRCELCETVGATPESSELTSD
jgi:hypothetical protein